MALTVTLSGDWMTSLGNRRQTFATVAFDNSYTTGGLALTAAQVGLGVVEELQADPKSGYIFEYDYTNSKLKAYYQTDPANAGGANIPLIEVANATNLSTLTGVRVTAEGR